MKRYIKKIWCWLTGGHAYRLEDLHSHYDSDRECYIFRNRCVKCGKVDKWEVPAENIFPPIVRNELFVEVDDG